MTLTSRWFIFVLALFIYLPAGIFAREVPVSGKSVAGLDSLDRLMTDFLTEHHVVGAALAVSRNGRLVYCSAHNRRSSLFWVIRSPDPLVSMPTSKMVGPRASAVRAGKPRLFALDAGQQPGAHLSL